MPTDAELGYVPLRLRLKPEDRQRLKLMSAALNVPMRELAASSIVNTVARWERKQKEGQHETQQG